MPTITFKVAEAEARELRRRAQRDQLTLSESIRRQLLGPTKAQELKFKVCPVTGAPIFAGGPEMEPLTTASVREMSADFP
ncbi:MAG: hypothetical protein JSR82_01295 [Verrucomicrobia bacterium]|nr:hypothetical protein [Verrucomicrobiota bacterium]